MLELNSLIPLTMPETLSAARGGAPIPPKNAPSVFCFSGVSGGYLISVVVSSTPGLRCRESTKVLTPRCREADRQRNRA